MKSANDMLERFHAWHKTRQGFITVGLVELVFLYIFASIAIDTANMVVYVITFILLFGCAVNLINAISYGRAKRKIEGAAVSRKR